MPDDDPRGHVLIVDDDEMLRRTLTRALTRFGYGCDAVGGGREALELLARGGYDLVITDMRMPGMSGDELLREASASLDELPPVIVLSGYHDHDPDELARLGARAVLPKPISTKALRDHIEAVLKV
jgi:DNA-binding response OmpR family regulator